MGKDLTAQFKTVRSLVESYKTNIVEALPKQLDKDRFVRICLTQFSRNPALMNCTATSLVASMIQSAMIGLEPDGIHAALIPYKNHGVSECQLQPMYQGLIQLARRAGLVTLFYADVVYQNDTKFHVQRGLNPDLVHIPALSGDRGKVLGAYAVFKLRSGDSDFEWMTMDEILKVKKVSKSASSKESPWNNWPEEMYKKTAIKRLAKRAPREAGDDLQRAIEIDNQQDNTLKNYDFREVFDEIGAPVPDDAALPAAPIAEPARKSASTKKKGEPEQQQASGSELNPGGGTAGPRGKKPGSATPIGGGGPEPDSNDQDDLPFQDAGVANDFTEGATGFEDTDS